MVLPVARECVSLKQEDSMTDHILYIPLIVDALQTINPYKIYLFGSVASGNVTDDSDIDILIILDSEKIHKTYDDRIRTRVQVRKAIMSLSHQVPIDILVYSKPEYLKLSETNPWFAQEVEKKGGVIYERYHT
jgi:predicted nucleotidyltransferase